MGVEKPICPICLNEHGAKCVLKPRMGDFYEYECDVCGVFKISSSVLASDLTLEHYAPTPVQRASLSHQTRQSTNAGSVVFLKTDWLKHFFDSNAKLPTPTEQANNIIALIGDYVAKEGKPLEHCPIWFYAAVGSPNPHFAFSVVLELIRHGILNGIEATTFAGPEAISLNLTLQGWEQYEQYKRGRLSGNYGFIAMKFHDGMLDKLVKEHIKPKIKLALNYDVFDMRDFAQAGIIDNIMRMKIRDSAFVLADLTHDNYGAYWEAGYAEGLGKPVLYICEKNKFDDARTHFDTNHCTTVLWDESNLDHFIDELIATIRRSLNLF